MTDGGNILIVAKKDETRQNAERGKELQRFNVMKLTSYFIIRTSKGIIYCFFDRHSLLRV